MRKEIGKKLKILVINDDRVELKCLTHNIKKFGFDCISTKNSLEALELAHLERPDVVITDLMMPKKDGIELLKDIKNIDSNILIIISTVYGSVSSAIEAIKLGAYDYLEKPYTTEQLKVTLYRALEYKKLSDENLFIRNQNRENHSFKNIIGKSAVIQELFGKLVKISACDANVLIYGESGTGKELIARSIHTNSNRSSNSFIPVDCVALPETLLESELFGYEKGAFTGAQSMRRGLLEYADKGTLFLDEICELSKNLQAKLLRVLQEREFRRIGGKRLIKVDLRILSATNKNPVEAVKTSLLREDLYYRLNVIPLEVPPLRERKEDISELVYYYLNKFSNMLKLKEKVLEPEAIQALVNYFWPGNVRELKNVIERITSLVDGPKIRFSDLPDHIISSKHLEKNCLEPILDLPFFEAKNKIIEQFEREYLIKVLKKYSGNISRAAEQAQISRRTMYRFIRNYNLHNYI